MFRKTTSFPLLSIDIILFQMVKAHVDITVAFIKKDDATYIRFHYYSDHTLSSHLFHLSLVAEVFL